MTTTSSNLYDVIVGASGQDGYYLNKKLRSLGRKLLCIDTNGLINHEGTVLTFNINNTDDVSGLFRKYRINHVYYLAAYHHSAEDCEANDFHTLTKSMDIHVYALENFLKSILEYSPATRIFYAASSHLFSGYHNSSNKGIITIDENTPLSPKGWYAHTKAIGVELMRNARENDLFAVSGFLFNHESEKRPPSFLSSKLTNGAIDAFLGKREKISLLNVDSKVDWGYAPDFIDAMYLSLQAKIPQNYVISTGKLHTIENYAQLVYGLIGLNWQEHITINDDKEKKLGGASALVGNSSRLISTTNWQPTISFEEMVARILLDTAKARNVKLEIK